MLCCEVISFQVTNCFLVQVEGECVDGEELRIKLLAEEDISKSVESNREAWTADLGMSSSPA